MGAARGCLDSGVAAGLGWVAWERLVAAWNLVWRQGPLAATWRGVALPPRACRRDSLRFLELSVERRPRQRRSCPKPCDFMSRARGRAEQGRRPSVAAFWPWRGGRTVGPGHEPKQRVASRICSAPATFPVSPRSARGGSADLCECGPQLPSSAPIWPASQRVCAWASSNAPASQRACAWTSPNGPASHKARAWMRHAPERAVGASTRGWVAGARSA